MFSFLLRKMLNNKWMIASLLIGNILLIGTVSSVPLYSQATLQRMFIKEMEQYQINTNNYPGLMELRYQFNYVDEDRNVPIFIDVRDRLNDKTINDFSLTPFLRIESISLQNINFTPEIQREKNPKTRSGFITSFSDFEDHMTIVQGELFGDEMRDGTIDAVVSQRTLEDLDILVGEILESGNLSINGELVKIRIAGVFENSLDDDYYWTTSPSSFSNRIIISESIMNDVFLADYKREYRAEVVWQTLFDYHQINIRDLDRFISTETEYKEYFLRHKDAFKFKTNFVPIMSGYQEKAAKLNITLWVLQVPVFILLAFFIFMVSKQILSIEQNEISVIKSRGAGRGQIILIYFMQGLIVNAISLIAGIPLGLIICKVLGASNGFLNLVQRSSLSVRLNEDTLIYSIIASAVSIMTMIIPVIRYSRVTIVDYKRSKTGKTKKPMWQRLFLDVLALGISLYALYTYNNQRELLAKTLTSVQSVDPLLFLSSSLFIIGLGLLLLRIFPYIVKLIFFIGKKHWSPPMYASFLKVVRSAGEEQFIMIFLVFTLAAGIFDAKAARTINLNADDKIRYEIGADLTFKEAWSDNRTASTGITGPGGMSTASESPKDIVYTEPDFERFSEFPQVDSITKVLREKVNLNLKEGKLDGAQLMAIHSKSFGETAWFRDDLFPSHMNYYLNVLAKEPKAVLLSSNFKGTYGYKIGDIISFKDNRNNYAGCIVYGFTDYWPGFKNVERSKGSDGMLVEKENWLIVGNLNYIQSIWGLTPYEIWMKTNSSSNNFIYKYAEDNGIRFTSFSDAAAEITHGKNDPILQGTNGVLTVGFITILLICTTGFLIYWILSIKSRVLQFGIFRAMGMSMRNVSRLLLNEQAFITGMAIAIGTVVGETASRLYVPIIQVAYTAAEQVIPFKIITQSGDYIRLFTIIGVMVTVCIAILGMLISNIKMAQALKLGED